MSATTFPGTDSPAAANTARDPPLASARPPVAPAPTLADQLAQVGATPAEQVTRDLARCRASVTGKARETVAAMLPDPAAARDALADLLERAWHELVAPFWPEIEALLDA